MAMTMERTLETQETQVVSADAASVADALLDSVVLVQSSGGSGSGVIWRSDGLIVTNSHVMHSDTARIILRDGRRMDAELVARDPDHDLAALRVQAEGLPAVLVGDSSRLRVGQFVLAVGNPMGMRGVVTAGIITGVGQVSQDGRTRLDDLIQADVALAPGNSGGPLADSSGAVLGINSMISGSGIALAIPSQVVQEFLSPERESRAYVGITGMDASLKIDGEPQQALLLTSVEEGSPADRAGLILGDVMYSFADEPITGIAAFRKRLAAWEPGSPATVHVVRGGTPREFTVVPATRMTE